MVGFVPKEMFFTKGVGKHREKLTSFELALRAGLGVLRKIFSATPPTGGPVSRKSHRTTAKRKAYVVEGAKQ